jgi:uncharacterized protein (TIGR04222 family)
MSGPQFLLLYFIIALGTNIWLRWHYDRKENASNVPRLADAPDPYLIALLRKGRIEAIQVALFALIDRGLLAEHSGRLKAETQNAEAYARRPIELALLKCYKEWGDIDKCYTDGAVLLECEKYLLQLENEQLLAGASTFADRRKALAFALAGCLFIGIARIVNAISEGRHNSVQSL